MNVYSESFDFDFAFGVIAAGFLAGAFIFGMIFTQTQIEKHQVTVSSCVTPQGVIAPPVEKE